MKYFIGRHEELSKIKGLARRGRPVLVVIKGRRRVGKSYLVQEAAKGQVFLPFAGLAPVDHMTAQDQRDAFARQFAELMKIPPLTFSDWQDVFAHITLHLTQKPTVILFDEISWMSDRDPTFISKLKNWWDLVLQNYPNLMLILCSSISTWIEKHIISSTAFFGRISLTIDLPELSLSESYEFLKNRGCKYSIHDFFKILSVTGGIPWYLEQISPNQTVEENLKSLCFEKDGMFVLEFDRIFNDLFNKRGEVYKKIVQILAEGMKDLSEIRDKLSYPKSGYLSDILNNLIISGFVTRHYHWTIKTGSPGRQSLYRLSDNYIRFYIKYIQPNLAKISTNYYKNFNLNNLKGWEAMMGFQVESLLLKNRHLLLEALGLDAADIVADNPYIQKTAKKREGCQIDYLVQTHSNNLFICEFKFSRRELSIEVIKQVKQKIRRFITPRGFGVCPVLLHLGGVADEVYDQRYFYRIIDMADFLGKMENSH